ncbi:MAG: peptidoglycan bridge formation glycyltransferase FemA/FemB family protein [Prevotellaceae bacterium]|jgi:hypothetical protein|nr:peptidoglycan bridge formation glycyltransferase FemA/FemB family protein [Prevotellaceae bacterium]
MQQIDKNKFFAITQTFDYVPFTQSEGWRAYSSSEESRFVFFVDNTEKSTIACMGYVIRKFGLKMLQIAGECLRNETEIDSKKIRVFYHEISQTDFDIIEVNSSLKYSALYETGIREAGYLRPVGLFSTPLTIEVNLQKKIEFDKSWRRNLRYSEQYNLDFKAINNPTKQDINDYYELNYEMVKRKNLSESFTANMLKNLLNDDKFCLFVAENENKKRIAGLIVYIRNNFANSILSVTSIEGREKSASYFLFEKTFRYCAEIGIKTYDCGRICPSTHSKQSVFLFKNGVKGEKVQYCGEFAFYKRPIYRVLMYFIKKYLFKRVEV